MKWEGGEESQNVEDQRGVATKAGVALGGGGILIVLLALLFGIDPQRLAGVIPQGGQPGGEGGEARRVDPAEEPLRHFSAIIFRHTEVVWEEQFAKMGKRYKKPTLVLFSDVVNSACGTAESAVGPFYCPGDEKVYIDLSFYREMEQKLGAGGEFARAYVLAHEVGHHVQRLLGYSARVDEARQTMSAKEYNKMSVRLELQADFLAGVWAYHGQKKFNFLEPGDLESALNAAHQIGDDYLQKQARGRVMPEKFTHGTSAQRMRWFKDGFDTGDVRRARLLFDLDYNQL
jgi:predicted metalloprotease